MVASDDVAVLLGDSVDELLELGRVDSDELVAVGALQMVMMRLEGIGQLVALFPADMDYLDDVQLLVEFECTVDAGAVYSPA